MELYYTLAVSQSETFNYFFTIMAVSGVILLVPKMIIRVIMRS